jgi:hypothetical protein
MHEFLREYAAEQLASDPTDEQAIRWRHAEHYAALLLDPAKALSEDETMLDREVENLLERSEPAGTYLAKLDATATRGLRLLRRYARSFPMARPRALTWQGWCQWLESRHRIALRAWAQAVQESERLAMPWELARAHYELGRHLASNERSPFGLQGTQHLDQAKSILEALGCGSYPTDADALI